MWVFCYGSNNLKQLTTRTGHIGQFEYYPARLDGYKRVFAGYSERWKGGVASIAPASGQHVDGLLVNLTKDELTKLDQYETGYKHKRVIVINLENKTQIKAIVYIKTDSTYTHPPSARYLKAISQMLRDAAHNKTGL